MKLRECDEIKAGDVFLNCKRFSMLRVIRVYDCYVQEIGVPGGNTEKHVDYFTWRPDGAKQGTIGKMRLKSLMMLPYLKASAVRVYAAGLSFEFELTKEEVRKP